MTASVIAISSPIIGELEEKLVLEVLRSGHLVKGPMVARFEESVRDVVGTRFAIAVNSGTSALIASLLAHEIGPGDEVITSPFTFVATLNAILHVGATPRFVDVADDFNLDPSLLDDALTHATRAILPVHLYGCPADLVAVKRVLGTRETVIIEDAAQALGASCDGRAVGSFGTGCFSFYATKNVTTAEGGVVTTDDEHVAAAVRILADQGQSAAYEYARPGFNLRMSELHAALGVAQMTRLGDVIDRRRTNASLLHEGLDGIDGLVLPSEPVPRRHVFHQFTVRVTEGAAATRDELIGVLRSRGIGCAVYYPRPVFEYECFRNDPRIGRPRTPRAQAFARQVVSLPVHPTLGESEIAIVVGTVRDVLERRSSL